MDINFSSVIIFIAFSVSACPSVNEPGSIMIRRLICPKSFSNNTSNLERVKPTIDFLNFTSLIFCLLMIGAAELFMLATIE
jgi:hypothetical protein